MRLGHTPHTCVLDLYSLGLDLLPHAQAVQHAGHVGGQLDACSNETQVGRVLEHVDVLESLFGQRQRTGQSAHTLRR